MIEAYPLCWPVGQKRTAAPERSRFGANTLTQSIKLLLREVERMKGKDPIISSNVPVKLDGTPYASYKKGNTKDRGVAVYFMRKGSQVVLACDKWDTVEDNIRAITLTIESMRSLDRWGVSEMLDRAFSGFAALPAPGQAHSHSCWDVLGIGITKDKAAIRTAYMALAKKVHPDIGGSAAAMAEVGIAYTEATKYAEQ